MYRNAVVTLGVQHAQITVALPITARAPWQGIYYLEDNGATILRKIKT